MLLHEEQSGRFLRRPKQDYPAATVAEFCTAVLMASGETRIPPSGHNATRPEAGLLSEMVDPPHI
jgi:hypothetical protein